MPYRPYTMSDAERERLRPYAERYIAHRKIMGELEVSEDDAYVTAARQLNDFALADAIQKGIKVAEDSATTEEA